MKMAAIFALTWIGFISAGAFAGDRNQDYREANRRHWEHQRKWIEPQTGNTASAIKRGSGKNASIMKRWSGKNASIMKLSLIHI